MRQKIVFRTRVESWLTAWADLACSIISILTLAYYRPWWDFKLRCFFMKRQLNKKRREGRNKK